MNKVQIDTSVLQREEVRDGRKYEFGIYGMAAAEHKLSGIFRKYIHFV